MNQQQAENDTGYWLIELDATAVLSATSAYHGFASAFFAWLAEAVSDRLDLRAKSITLETIEANYQGAYPCLAATSLAGKISDADANEIESAINETLRTTTLKDFLEAMSSHQLPARP